MGRIDDGFPTLITFGQLSTGLTLKFWEKEVTPPGMDGGGEVDTTTMRNTAWRTRSPKQLVTMSNMDFVAAYDPGVYDQVVSELININGLITVTFPNGDTLEFYGWLDKFIMNSAQEGQQPTAQCTIVPSNQNAYGVETAPVYTAA